MQVLGSLVQWPGTLRVTRRWLLVGRVDFEVTNVVADLGRILVAFLFHGRSQFTAELDEPKLLLAGTGCALGNLAAMLGLAVNVFQERQQLILERDVVVRTTKPTLRSKLLERDATAWAGALIEFVQVLFRFGLGPRRHFIERFRGCLGEVLLCTRLAQMQSLNFTVSKFGDVQDGGFGAATALFHDNYANRFSVTGLSSRKRPRGSVAGSICGTVASADWIGRILARDGGVSRLCGVSDKAIASFKGVAPYAFGDIRWGGTWDWDVIVFAAGVLAVSALVRRVRKSFGREGWRFVSGDVVWRRGSLFTARASRNPNETAEPRIAPNTRRQTCEGPSLSLEHLHAARSNKLSSLTRWKLAVAELVPDDRPRSQARPALRRSRPRLVRTPIPRPPLAIPHLNGTQARLPTHPKPTRAHLMFPGRMGQARFESRPTIERPLEKCDGPARRSAAGPTLHPA